MKRRVRRTTSVLALLGLTGVLAGCLFDSLSNGVVGSAVVIRGTAFSERLIQARTFVNGVSVTTVTYNAADKQRIALGIDFNADGRIDPVVGYGPATEEGETQSIVQILLSRGATGTVDYTSLTLDSKLDWTPLSDVAVGDIDGDGKLDIVAATGRGLVYLHHPGGALTTELALWGSSDPALELIEGSTSQITNDDLSAILAATLGPGVNLDSYDISVEQGYTRAIIADFDGDNDNDIGASRRVVITLNPKPNTSVPTIQIVDGVVQVFVNPRFARDGAGWGAVSVGKHERHQRLDRDGASGLVAYDLDGDGDLDIVSAARLDNNAQVAWFENPGGPLNDQQDWNFWRVGSVRDAISVDVADVTGDGRPDVVATGGAQQQLMLFEQPVEGPKRTYDWDTYPVVTFESFEPRDVKVFDIDADGQPEMVVSATGGAVRYFERPENPRTTWSGVQIINFDPPGDVGYLGYGDLDGDGDLDLVAVVNDESEQNNNGDHVSWIRNDLFSSTPATLLP